MYSTCLFCKSSLGSNEIVEAFPVGRRLAFDPAKGRLWVVCRKCERWNLSPFEERWEAIETCERLFRDTRVRSSSDNVGLARLSEGLELVRIGTPLRPEFAAWRYGDQFGRRRRRSMWYGAAGAAAVTALAAGSFVALGTAVLLSPSIQLANLYNMRRSLFRFRSESGRMLHVHETTLRSMRLVVSERADDWRLQVHVSPSERVLLVGEEARRFASLALPRVNQAGGTAKVVGEAVSEIERTGGPEGFLLGITEHVTPRSGILTGAILSNDDPRFLSVRVKPLSALPAPVRLAAEMSLHEAQERSALDGELALLEAAWRDAEEIASIADSMLLPPDIDSQLETLRRTRSRSD